MLWRIQIEMQLVVMVVEQMVLVKPGPHAGVDGLGGGGGGRHGGVAGENEGGDGIVIVRYLI